MKKSLLLLGALSLINSCGKDVEKTTLNQPLADNSLLLVENPSEFSECTQNNEGKLTYDKASKEIYICLSEEWTPANHQNTDLTAIKNCTINTSEEKNILVCPDGTSIELKNGIDGKDGTNGEDGKDGANGEDGKDGANGEDGKDGANGEDGKDGANGEDGKSCEIEYTEDLDVKIICGDEFVIIPAPDNTTGNPGQQPQVQQIDNQHVACTFRVPFEKENFKNVLMQVYLRSMSNGHLLGKKILSPELLMQHQAAGYFTVIFPVKKKSENILCEVFYGQEKL